MTNLEKTSGGSFRSNELGLADKAFGQVLAKQLRALPSLKEEGAKLNIIIIIINKYGLSSKIEWPCKIQLACKGRRGLCP